MADLIYTAIASLDGYVNDVAGNFDWAEPSDEVHAFVNDLERLIGTYLYGRRLYEVMAYWQTVELEGQPDPVRDYAEIWRAADKVVYSSTLEDVWTPWTRLASRFDADEVHAMKETAAADLGIGGPTLAAEAFRAELIDEVRLFAAPVIVGGGTPAFPEGVRLDLKLTDERRFDNGVVYTRHRVRGR
jgi:dihydrofolate reductase